MTDTTPDTSERRCTATKADGERCGSFAMKDGSGLCAGHAGKGIAADPEGYGRQGHATMREQAKRRQEEAAAARMTLREALLHRAATAQAALVDALFAPVEDADLPAQERQRAAMQVLERLMGRPGEGIADMTQEQQPPSLAELVAALDGIMGLDEVGTQAVPDDEQPRMDAGVEALIPS